MRWARVEYDDGDGYWWERKIGRFGELYVDGLSGKWVACHFNGNGDCKIGAFDDAEAAKDAATEWLRMGGVEIANALADGCQPVDEE